MSSIVDQIMRTRALNNTPIGGTSARVVEVPDNSAQGGATPDFQRQRGITSQFTVTNAVQQMLPANFNRRFLFVQNNDPLGSVTLSVGNPNAQLGVGFNLPANGGGILLDQNVPTTGIWCIGSIASNPNVSIVEG